MNEKAITGDYWNNLYEKHETGWDIGYPSPALKNYIDQLTDKNVPILIPGCGNAYEAAYLVSLGFTSITLIDIAPLLTAALETKFRNELGKQVTIITGDFFQHTGKYKLILEQTFLSALPPDLRTQYANQMHSLLVKGGHLAGVIFNKIFDDGPPFGGTIDEYRKLFEEKFIIKTLEPCYNSIERRKDSEAFINLIAR